MSSGAGAGERQDESSASAASLTTSAPARFVPVAIFILALVTYAWFYSGGGWNQNAHFDLTRALVERGTFRIDGYQGNTGDVSWVRRDGEAHVYINKPPGASFLAAIPYGVIHLIERAFGVTPGAWPVVTLNAYLTTVLTCGVTGALIPAVLYTWARKRVSRQRALGLALAAAFGTGVLPYSTLLFAHVPAALFLLLAFVWIDDRPLVAGAAAGIAGTCYYLCIPAAGVMFAGALVKNRRSALRFLAGGIPFGLLLAIYHFLCFGSPFRTALEASTQFTDERLFLGLFRMPSGKAAWGMLFSEYRGLFPSTPIVVFAVVGAIVMLRERLFLRELTTIVMSFALFVFVLSGFSGWHGGSAFGPRYLIPVVPLILIPLAFTPKRLVGLAIAAGVLSASIQLLATAVDPTPSGRIGRPLRDFLLPTYVTGRLPRNVAVTVRAKEVEVGSTSVDRQSIDEIVPHRRYPIGSEESLWASFNLGELIFGAGNPLSILPIALWMGAGSVLLFRRTVRTT